MDRRAIMYGTILALATLSGCSHKQAQQQEEKQAAQHKTTAEVPVISYRVQQRDSLNSLFQSEVASPKAGKPMPEFYRPTAVNSDYTPVIALYGGRVINDVKYLFEGNEIMNLINPSHAQFTLDTRLRQGETINFPDFTRDGKVRGHAGAKQGTLTLEGTCDDQGKLLRKEIAYNGQRRTLYPQGTH